MKNWPSQAKVITIISMVVAVAAIAALLLDLALGWSKTSSPNYDDPTPTTSRVENPASTSVIAPPSTTQTSTPGTPTATDTSAPQSTESSYAFISDWNDGAANKTNLAFEFVDWLTGEAAVEMYMQDFPGISAEDAELMTQEAGYIRNVNPELRWFTTTDSSAYYLPDDNLVNKLVSYDTFKLMMLPAIDAKDDWLTFVEVTTSSDMIVKIEWAYRP